MISARHRATVDAPPEALWARLAALESWPRWLRAPYAGRSVTVTSPAPYGRGTEFVLKGRLPYRFFARIVEWEQTRLLAFEIYRSEYPSDRFFFSRAVIRLELEAVDGARTRVTCSHQFEGKGLPGRLYGAVVMRPLIRSNVRRVLENLTRGLTRPHNGQA